MAFRFFRPGPVNAGLTKTISNLYANQCSQCGGKLPELSGNSGFMDLFNDFAKVVYERKGKDKYVDRKMQQAYAEKFTDALMQGLGGKAKADAFAFNSSQAATIAKLKTNVYAFSCAKSLSEAKQMAALLYDEKGNIRTFARFRNEVERINKLYNESYLNTEYNTAIAQAEAAVKWDNIQENKHLLGCLRYRTMEDGNVRPEHASLNNIKRPVDDPWWNTYYPPLSWNCRCTVVQEECGTDKTPDEKAYTAGKQAGVKPQFKTNVGKVKVLFDAGHPYYSDVRGKLTELDAEKNYGMKSWAQMHRLMEDMMPAPPAQTKDQFNSWWNNMVKTNGVGGENFVVKDVLDNHVLFDATSKRNDPRYFREHIFSRNRTDIGFMGADIIKHPDEVWHFHLKAKQSKMAFSYLKYYNDKIALVFATMEPYGLKAKTMYFIKGEKEFNNLRKGILMFSNKKF